MEQKKQSNLQVFLKNHGFYLVLVLCLVAVGTAIALLAIPEKQQEAEPNPPLEEEPFVIVGQSNDETLKDTKTATATLPPLGTPTPTLLPTVLPTVTPTEEPKVATSTKSKAAPPVKGEILFGFAVEQLLYSVTLDQWTTHDGVDIASPIGTEVACVFSGTVTEVREDDTLGFFVRVAHSNGRETVYANLAPDIRVGVGDKLNAGETLGTVGDSALSECGLAPHLHFALYIDGKATNPEAYVRLG